MSSRFSRSWSMVKASMEVLRKDRELMIFPVISGIAIMLISVIFGFSIFFSDSSGSFSMRDFGHYKYLIYFAFYVVFYTIVIFFNSALISAASVRLKGGDPDIREAIKNSFNHIGAIIGYALIASTVGTVLNWISNKLGVFGKIFTFIADLGWNVITFLVAPVLVIEGVGPVEAVKRSAHLLKKTWGEQVIGNISISLVMAAAVLIVFILFMPFAIYFTLTRLMTAVIILGVVFAVIFIALAVMSSTLNAIYVAALYRYAVEGEVSGSFDADLLRESFTKK